jgi:hypothetical protein
VGGSRADLLPPTTPADRVGDLIAAAAATAAARGGDAGASAGGDRCFAGQELAAVFWAAAAVPPGVWDGGARPPTPPAVWAALAPAGAASLAATPASWSPQAVSMAAWACGRARWRDERLLAAAAAHAGGRLGEWGPQALANLAWAAATLGCAWPPGLAQAALLRATASAGAASGGGGGGGGGGGPQPAAQRASPQALANLLWAAGTMGQLPPGLLASIASSPGGYDALMTGRGPGSGGGDGRGLDQVWQADRLCVAGAGAAARALLPGGGGGGGGGVASPTCLPPDLASAAVAARVAAVTATPPHASGLHNAVLAAALRAVGEGEGGGGHHHPRARARVEAEALIAGATLRVDVAVVVEWEGGGGRAPSPPPPLRIALEADGPAHYLASHAPSPATRTGGTVNRDALLAAAGWFPVPVPYAAWDALGGDPVAEAVFVRGLLDGAVRAWKAEREERAAAAAAAAENV